LLKPAAPLVGSPCVPTLFGGILSAGGTPDTLALKQLGALATSLGYKLKTGT